MEPSKDKPQTQSDAGQQQDNPLINVLLNVIVPVIVLSKFSAEDSLGPRNALIVAVSIPIAYGIYHFLKHRQLNLFSALGLVSVVLTGGLGLMKTSAVWFAAKEAIIPFILGLAIIFSHYISKRPLVRTFLLSPSQFNIPLIEEKIAENGQEEAFEGLIKSGTWMMAGSMFLSAVMNFFLNLYLLIGKEPGSTEYMKAIGRSTWVGFLVIGIPITAILFYGLIKMIKGLETMTKLDRDDLMRPREK